MMQLIRTIRHILAHPLNRSARWETLKRYFRWQVSSRMALGPTIVSLVNETNLIVTPGMTGATGNIYSGLHDFPDCGFLLHLLRSSDLFIDAGANVGVYTVLASGVTGARSVSIEPIPSTFAKLRSNILINNIAGLVTSHNIGLGRASDTLRFTSDRDTRNHVVPDSAITESTIEVAVRQLDEILGNQSPTLIKIDVEGWESEVLAGAQQTLGQPSLLGLIVEMNSQGDHLTPNEQSVHDTLTQNSFEPYVYDPFTRRLSRLSSKNVGASNTIYVRNLEIVQERLIAALPFHVRGKHI